MLFFSINIDKKLDLNFKINFELVFGFFSKSGSGQAERPGLDPRPKHRVRSQPLWGGADPMGLPTLPSCCYNFLTTPVHATVWPGYYTLMYSKTNRIYISICGYNRCTLCRKLIKFYYYCLTGLSLVYKL